MTSLFIENMQNGEPFDRGHHEEWNESCCVSIDQLQWTQWTKNRLKSAKTKNLFKKKTKKKIEQNQCSLRHC